MMKYVRGLYVTVCYIVGLPIWFVLSTIVFVPWSIKLMVRDDYDMRDMKELIEAYIEGLKCGHKTNMHWIKYGNQSYDLNKLSDL